MARGTFKPGDVVTLKGGSPRITLSEYTEGDPADGAYRGLPAGWVAHWFVQGAHRTATLDPVVLVLAERGGDTVRPTPTPRPRARRPD